MRLLLALAAFTLVLTPDASACWDKTDKLIQELKQLDLDTEQLKDIFEYQREHRLLIAQAHQEGLGCSFHEGKTVDFQKSAIGVLDDAQFKSYTGRERTEAETLRYENYLLQREIARLKLELEKMRAELEGAR